MSSDTSTDLIINSAPPTSRRLQRFETVLQAEKLLVNASVRAGASNSGQGDADFQSRVSLHIRQLRTIREGMYDRDLTVRQRHVQGLWDFTDAVQDERKSREILANLTEYKKRVQSGCEGTALTLSDGALTIGEDSSTAWQSADWMLCAASLGVKLAVEENIIPEALSNGYATLADVNLVGLYAGEKRSDAEIAEAATRAWQSGRKQ